MAKTALSLSNLELARMTGLHRNTRSRLDRGDGKSFTIKLVRLPLEAAGVQLMECGDVAAAPGIAILTHDDYQPEVE